METGLDNFLKKEHQSLRGARIGILCNQASVTKTLTHISKAVLEKKLKLTVTCFIGPQHGIRGEKQDNMVESDDFTDPASGLPVFSLYGTSRVPNQKILQQIDALVVDLQDIGTRIYTFMYTLANCMREAKKHGKRVIVLDRPNPINGVDVEGNLLEEGFTSFVGQFPIVTRHGMSMGELAMLFNEEFKIGCELSIVRCAQWKRGGGADLWKRPWIAPSPNIPICLSAWVFPGTVHFEGTNVSEGRGTTRPFENIGAPFIDADALTGEMNAKRLKGVLFRPIYFQPTFQKWANQVCGGVCLHITQFSQFKPVRTGLELLATVAKMYPGQFQWKQPPYEYETDHMPIDLIAGTDQLRKTIDAGGDIKVFLERCGADSHKFSKVRRQYLLYR